MHNSESFVGEDQSRMSFDLSDNRNCNLNGSRSTLPQQVWTGVISSLHKAQVQVVILRQASFYRLLNLPNSPLPISPLACLSNSALKMATPATASSVTVHNVHTAGASSNMQEVWRSVEGTGLKDYRYKPNDEKSIVDVKVEPASAGWKDKDISFPDGGWRAWLVVAGAMCCAFST